MHRIGRWGGYKVGALVVADEPFEHRVGHCSIEKEEVTLPNGVRLGGVRGRPIAEFLGIGTLAVAIEHTGDCYNQYIPLAAIDLEHEQVLRPFIDLEFGAYGFGQTIDNLDLRAVRQLAAGNTIEYAGGVALSTLLNKR
jgi:hypothetical protein